MTATLTAMSVILALVAGVYLTLVGIAFFVVGVSPVRANAWMHYLYASLALTVAAFLLRFALANLLGTC